MSGEFGSVEEVLRAAGRPLQMDQIVSRVGKSERNCWKELEQLRLRKQVVKLAFQVSMHPDEISRSTVLYKWVKE